MAFTTTVRKRATSVHAAASDHTIWNDGSLVDLTIGFWSGRKALRPQDLEPLGVNPEDVPDIFSLGRKLLVPASTIKAFRNCESRARYKLEKASFGFPIAGVRFVPTSMLDVLLTDLQMVKNEFTALADQFLDDYAGYRSEFLQKYWRFYDQMRDIYPTEDEVLEKFTFEWNLFAITIPEFTQKEIDDIGANAIRKAAAIDYERKLAAQMGNFVEEVASELRTRTATTCRRVANMVKDGKVITEHSMKSLRDFVSEFRAMNFVGDMDVEKQLNELSKTWLSHDALTLKNNVSMADGLRVALEAVAEKAESTSDLSEVTGTYRRKIRL